MLSALVRGDTNLYFLGLNQTIEYVEAGKLNALAIATPRSNPVLPNVPTFAEAGLPEYRYDSWFGVMAPANTPQTILKRISDDIGDVMQMSDVRDRLARQGVDVVTSAPDLFDSLIRSDAERYGKMMRDAGLGAN